VTKIAQAVRSVVVTVVALFVKNLFLLLLSPNRDNVPPYLPELLGLVLMNARATKIAQTTRSVAVTVVAMFVKNQSFRLLLALLGRVVLIIIHLFFALTEQQPVLIVKETLTDSANGPFTPVPLSLLLVLVSASLLPVETLACARNNASLTQTVSNL
jgi:hypothetical protein